MRVQHVFKDYAPTFGGVEQHIADVSRSLPGFEFSVLTSSRTRQPRVERVDGVDVVRGAEWARPVSVPIVPAWWHALRRAGAQADLLHLHLPNPFAEAAFLRARPPIPAVATFHADMMRHPRLARVYRPVQDQVLRRAEAIVVSSPRLADDERVRHHPRLTVIPFGVDPPDDATDSRASAIRAGVPGPLVLFLGRLVWYKGVDVLIRAMAGVDATLVVAGDGPERHRLQRLAGRTGVGGRVRFVGPVTDGERAAYYRAADVFVLPSVSRAETFGIAMLEAMASGTPVVSTELRTGTSWVNRSGETGLVVPPRHPAALARAITFLLADRELRRDLGAAAARRAAERFPKSAMLAALAELYVSLAAGTPARVAHAPRAAPVHPSARQHARR